MKTLILAGGFGTRLSEETGLRPKPMVEIGGKPILWHIMKLYASQGFTEFVILLGYKGYMIKEFFANYYLHQNDFTIDLSTNEVTFHFKQGDPWKVTLIDTGENSMTGGRIKRAKDYINNETFMLTYGDGLSNVNLNELLDFHKSHGGKATMTTIQPEGRFGQVIRDSDNKITEFKEKPIGEQGWINGGFFVCDASVMEFIDGDKTVFEKEPLEKLATDKELYAFEHSGFWKCMDTLRDKQQLEELWSENKAPWKLW
jgi:glucose-1-phosphate cytidylyltransferase